jgi:hypothetical protein
VPEAVPVAGGFNERAGNCAQAIGSPVSGKKPSMMASTGQREKLGKMDFMLGFCRICQRNGL